MTWEEEPQAETPGSTAGPTSLSTDWNKVQLPFKKTNFELSCREDVKNKKQWRNLKQIVNQDAGLWGPEAAITYGSIEAPPSFKPAKKYSDISGLEATYTDPHSKMHYATTEEFKLIRNLPGDIVAGYLTLRRASTQLQ